MFHLVGQCGFSLLLLLLLIIFFLYKKSLKAHNYWKDRNVPHPKPLPIIGNLLEILTFNFTGGITLETMYKRYETPYFGVYFFTHPILVIKSPELIKSVLIKDFNHFHDRHLFANEQSDAIAANMLFFLRGDSWKTVRSKLTSVFSSAKLKNILPLMDEVADEMVEYIEKELNEDPVDILELCSKYTTDVIATCAFGIKAQCFKNENAEFRNVGRKIFQFSWRNFFNHSCYFFSPTAVKYLKLSFLEKDINDFLREVCWATINKRNITSLSQKNDIVDVLKQLIEENNNEAVYKFEDDRIVAPAVTFLAAGFHTVALITSFSLYEICLHKDIQNRIREEIRSALSNHNGINYEALQDMKYLDMVILESLRKYPVLQYLDRLCTQDYQIPNTNTVIEKGTTVIIPTHSLHHDPKYFPDPEKFDPERFSQENGKNINGSFYLPFGRGPRTCIGEKLSMVEIKLALVRILLEYEVEKNIDTPDTVELVTKVFLIYPKSELRLRFKKIR